MSDGIQFSLIGIEDLRAKLDSVSYDMKRKGGRAALRRAANAIADKAREGARRLNDPATAENIEANIAVRWNGRLFKRKGDLGFRIGVLGGARQYAGTRENVRSGRAGKTYVTDGDKGNPGGDTWYWRLHEFGTEKMPARPFMRPALQQSISDVVSTFITEYDKALDRAIKRAARG